MNLQVKLCAGWGPSATDLEQARPAVQMLAYARYVLDVGMRGDPLALEVAFAPLRDRLRRDRDAARRAAQCARCSKPL